MEYIVASGKFYMQGNEDIRDIFSILHDGTISEWTGDKDRLTLTVECNYLAERIDKSFDKFYVELLDIDKIELKPWTTPADIPVVIKTSPRDIFEAQLEILSADIKDGHVIISCNQDDLSFDYGGGDLKISCSSIRILDQRRRELTIAQVGKICNDYWNEWSGK